MPQQELFGTLKPIGSFWAARSADIEARGESLENFVPIIITEAEYQALLDGEGVLYKGETIFFEDEKVYFIKQEIKDPNPIVKD